MFTPKSKLPRLPNEWYRGQAIVFWTHTTEVRARLPISPLFHARFRETLVHAGGRYALVCPAYVLMPDHLHIVWMGVTATSDQLLAAAFLRKHIIPLLEGTLLQDRPHDHVLRESERERDALQSTCGYVRENPVRAGLCVDWKDWPYQGAQVAGYPNLNPRDPDFWARFWRIHNRLVERKSPPCAHAQGYER